MVGGYVVFEGGRLRRISRTGRREASGLIAGG